MFSKIAESMGKKVLAYDKKQGCDLLDRQTQLRVSQELEDARLELLVVCPPRAHEGGWENLNQFYRTPIERARLSRNNKGRRKFCVDQIHNQLRRGGDFLFEHPWPSHAWHAPEMLTCVPTVCVVQSQVCQYRKPQV